MESRTLSAHPCREQAHRPARWPCYRRQKGTTSSKMKMKNASQNQSWFVFRMLRAEKKANTLFDFEMKLVATK